MAGLNISQIFLPALIFTIVLLFASTAPAVNATMLISSGGWFKSSSSVLLDPTDPQNENRISDNLRASIKVFKDNNEDGSKDAN